MTFLAPVFLLGLLGLVVPLVLHLRRRQSRERLSFPSLMFLEEVPHATIRRRRLRDLLLLAIRCGVVGLLTLAFAQPALRTGLLDTGAEGTEHLFVVVDRSASMTIGDRWSDAVEAVEERVGELAPADSVTLVLYDEAVEVALSAVSELGAPARVLSEVEPRDRASNLDAALQVTRPLVLDSLSSVEPPSRINVLIVSDFQVSSLSSIEDARFAAGVGVELHDVVPSRRAAQTLAAGNRWVQGIELQRGVEEPAAGDRESLRVIAQLGRPDGAPEEGGEVEARLWLGGRELERRTVQFDGRSARVDFDPVTLDEDRPSRGEVRIDGDGFAPDDRYFFVAEAGDTIDVLLVAEGRGREVIYLRQALESSPEPRYRVSTVRPQVIGASQLATASAVVVADAGSLPSAAESSIRRWVEEGGGVLVAYGDRSVDRELPSWLDLRSQREPVQDRAGARLTSLQTDHPVFEGLVLPGVAGAPFFRWFPLTVTDADLPTSRLAGLDDGSVALAVRNVGEGEVVAFGSTLDVSWNELPRRAAFLAWLDRILRHLSDHRPQRPAYEVGEPALLRLPESEREWVLVSPDGEALQLDAADEASEQSAGTLLTFEAAGHHALRPLGADAEVERWLAANLDRSESLLAPGDLEVLAAQLESDSPDSTPATAGPSTAPPPTSFWWLVAYALLLLLIGEVLVAGRLRRRAVVG